MIERSDRVLICDYPAGVDFDMLASFSEDAAHVFPLDIRAPMMSLANYLATYPLFAP